MDFYGTHEHTIDGKGRLVLPSSFRSAFADGGIATLLEDYAALFTHDEWDRYRRRIETSGKFDRDDLRHLFSIASPFEPDAQNRISLPQRLRDVTGLDREVAIVGSVRYVSIFSREEWARREAAIAAKAAEGRSLADKFRELDFL
ncbi:division/cell wall cluster transcriptional repressor MraZ [Dermatobacter hominis]|uniref:division/cell wall cluster transcriptional repressor MraZ n=1 Tax=Dermatobacter hominis TaxID=2884263 RepID=UPI001D10B248|nr:division/cell wall cluster transcriptional repressor MraZ [Dermatobacter hominis]UDY35969.1 division/cell wall cluster transcriptional repressor MraZ [Dermatobacter hominis]